MLLAMGAVWPVYAQQRVLPGKAEPGALIAHEYPYLDISGERRRLAPGGRIFDIHNRIILPVALSAPADVAFELDMNGDVSRLWLLTREERLRLDARKKSSR